MKSLSSASHLAVAATLALGTRGALVTRGFDKCGACGVVSQEILLGLDREVALRTTRSSGDGEVGVALPEWRFVDILDGICARMQVRLRTDSALCGLGFGVRVFQAFTNTAATPS